MSLSALSLSDFRLFEHQQLDCDAKLNIVIGDNGSGKTSLLESIYYLSHGRSFHTSNHNKVIRFDQENFVLSAEVANGPDDSIRVGLRRHRNSDVEIRIDGVSERRISQLAKVLPVQLITPESFKLFFGGPKERRQFFDFGLFHVKQSFYQDWLRFSKVLRHRNALLKKKPRQYDDEFAYWDEEFERLAVLITDNRLEYLTLFNARFEQTNLSIDSLLSEAGVQFQLNPGFNNEIPLAQQLRQCFDKDVKFGYTSVGPQKSDVKIKTHNRLVEDVMSRGQLKLLLYVVKLLQSGIISEHDLTPVMLIDDIASEVDSENLDVLFKFLSAAEQTQFFVTSLNRDVVEHLGKAKENHSMFHVKHGIINQVLE